MAESCSTSRAPALCAGPTAIDIEQDGDVCVIRCRGRLVAGMNEEYVRMRIEDFKRLNCSRVLADLREVPSIGSIGVAFLASVYTCVVKDARGRFVVAGAAPLVAHALELTKLSTVIPVVPDLKTALQILRA